MITAFISPMPNTPTLLHDHNEFLNEDIFLRDVNSFILFILNFW